MTTAAPTLVILCGLPGSGKTTEAMRLVAATHAIRLSADDWMHQLEASLWEEGLRGRVEQLQWSVGRELLARGVSVVIEWGTWGRSERDRLRTEARAIGARVELRFLDAEDEELWRRVHERDMEDPPMRREDITAYRAQLEAPTAAELALYDPTTPRG